MTASRVIPSDSRDAVKRVRPASPPIGDAVALMTWTPSNPSSASHDQRGKE